MALLGHSMGCAVIWSYWDLFGAERLARLVLVDCPPRLTADPAWSQAEREALGAGFTADSLFAQCNALASPDGEQATQRSIDASVTAAMPAAERAWMLAQNLRFPRPHAATLLYQLATQDWRDVIPRITLPTLIIGGRASLVPWQSQVWIHERIAGSRLELFTEEEGGNHYMFLEGPEKFNRLLGAFLG